MSWPLFNHVLQAGADKRCKGDYGSRRTSLRRGLGIMALHCVLTWRMNTSVFRCGPPQGVTEVLERFGMEKRDSLRQGTQIERLRIVCNL